MCRYCTYKRAKEIFKWIVNTHTTHLRHCNFLAEYTIIHLSRREWCHFWSQDFTECSWNYVSVENSEILNNHVSYTVGEILTWTFAKISQFLFHEKSINLLKTAIIFDFSEIEKPLLFQMLFSTSLYFFSWNRNFDILATIKIRRKNF